MFNRPYRYASSCPANPALEAPGYFQPSLRDFTKPLSRELFNGIFVDLVL
jgi:hypothetical protein